MEAWLVAALGHAWRCPWMWPAIWGKKEKLELVMHGRRVMGALEKPASNEKRKASCAGQLVRSRRKKVE